MAKYIVTGGRQLSGRIRVAGNKNAVLPAMAACLLTSETCVLENVPKISDVVVMAELLKKSGVKVTGIGSSSLRINAKGIHSTDYPQVLTQKLRASILLLSPVLSRLGKIKMGYPGGDIIGRRPLDVHIQVFKALGAKISESNDTFEAVCKKFKGSKIFLEEASVTATENAIMAAVLASGETVIKRAASEPHVVDLCQFLIKMGAKISGVGTNVLTIKGVNKLHQASYHIRPDHIEVGTFAILAAVTKSKIEISPVIQEDLDMIMLTLFKFGVDMKIKGNNLFVNCTKLKSVEKVVTDIWPGFPTDLMPPMIVLATQAEGVTILHDWMYESRMFFVDKLLSMGAKVEIADPHRVMVYGPTKLRGQALDTPDIRAGIALVIAALAAGGQSVIEKAQLIERGYENIVERLTNLGAAIKKVS
ncbi:UDP-N-acetylglucosamine 1-carboxyvinyltransferase [Candidatus Curtissbacteria bacterium RIFCSPHIGHO2_02_FULL_40_17]|uniref:UDP-N-acetylglucosamine 1-carboxyvinyltransferase n=3 Tax=Candidatus Curtissiibacteriota TaxID=1752717 RepID=A0A1F5GJN0_9BACT|nr:MAG: UDP-N-acetylglucosamine 1-carboxyvinyltransferase [Candidatus Curtissbacteria bacterium RIFCSPHIGHO2_01_FULL_40_12]OGD92019.1 MAG: UDP-N-acetylglucosamine 1-carboxyvinyltransferase [Candidatus Curtissbacteria bacterium RIFCSPHIGHO2_02_FULL_40_17]OGE07326.1 MAG: UDP-N-acetylglucosamine 1-carboxyvinyltransferase [Candidatus Curtissbacteria bacterium RIFCSPLOWO2_02_FULL_40_13b]